MANEGFCWYLANLLYSIPSMITPFTLHVHCGGGKRMLYQVIDRFEQKLEYKLAKQFTGSKASPIEQEPFNLGMGFLGF